MDFKRCRHCRRSKQCRPRGLCWKCYYTPGLRELYGTVGTTKFLSKGVGTLSSHGRQLPSESTRAMPGSPEKLAVLIERAVAGVSLWHPRDAHDGDQGDGRG